MSEIDFTTLSHLDCPLLEQPTNDMCMGDLIKLLAFNTAILERTVVNSIVPAGIVSYFTGQESDVPPRFLICDGSYYDPQTYPELFQKIRYTYGRDTDNCFAVPDLRVSIIQGVALGSECMDPSEDTAWEGRLPQAGAAVQGNVVGSRIKFAHNPEDPDNPNYFNSSTDDPQVGDSIYGKMALIPVISTGELCGRYEIQSTSTGGNCNVALSGLGGLELDGNELCLTNETGAVVDCVDLSSVVGTGGGGGLSASVFKSFKREYLDSPILAASGLGAASVNLGALPSVTVPSWATRVLVKGRAQARIENASSGISRIRIEAGGLEVVEAVIGGNNVNPTYTAGGTALKGDFDENDEEGVVSETEIVSVPINTVGGIPNGIMDYNISNTGSNLGGQYGILYVVGFEGEEAFATEDVISAINSIDLEPNENKVSTVMFDEPTRIYSIGNIDIVQNHTWIDSGDEFFGNSTGIVTAGITNQVPDYANEILAWFECDSARADSIVFRVKHPTHNDWKTVLASNSNSAYPNSVSVWLPLDENGQLEYEIIDLENGAVTQPQSIMFAIYGYKYSIPSPLPTTRFPPLSLDTFEYITEVNDVATFNATYGTTETVTNQIVEKDVVINIPNIPTGADYVKLRVNAHYTGVDPTETDNAGILVSYKDTDSNFYNICGYISQGEGGTGADEDWNISDNAEVTIPVLNTDTIELKYQVGINDNKFLGTGSANFFKIEVSVVGYEGLEGFVNPNVGQQLYYPDNGMSAWNITNGNLNMSSAVDINTVNGVTVPTWATHAILYGVFNSSNVAVCNVDIAGRTLSKISTSGGHTQHTVETTVPLSGTSLQVDITSSGVSNADIYILGFKNLFN